MKMPVLALFILLPLPCQAYDMQAQLAGWKYATQLLDAYPVLTHRLPIAHFEAKLEEINHQVNAFPYRDVTDDYGERNVWQTPVQLAEMGGQCRDYAVAKYQALYALGVADSDMFFTAVRVRSGKYKGQFHAVLLVKHGGVTYVLDSLRQDIRHSMADYQPIYFINRLGWRVAKGENPTINLGVRQ